MRISEDTPCHRNSFAQSDLASSSRFMLLTLLALGGFSDVLCPRASTIRISSSYKMMPVRAVLAFDDEDYPARRGIGTFTPGV